MLYDVLYDLEQMGREGKGKERKGREGSRKNIASIAMVDFIRFNLSIVISSTKVHPKYLKFH